MKIMNPQLTEQWWAHNKTLAHQQQSNTNINGRLQQHSLTTCLFYLPSIILPTQLCVCCHRFWYFIVLTRLFNRHDQFRRAPAWPTLCRSNSVIYNNKVTWGRMGWLAGSLPAFVSVCVCVCVCMYLQAHLIRRSRCCCWCGSCRCTPAVVRKLLIIELRLQYAPAHSLTKLIYTKSAGVGVRRLNMPPS